MILYCTEKILEVGDDVAELLGITKFVPEIPVQMSGNCRQFNSKFYKYTNIENIKNFPDVFQKGEEVIIKFERNFYLIKNIG